jgi:hypothetical protein
MNAPAGTELPPIPEGVTPPLPAMAGGGQPIWVRNKGVLGTLYRNERTTTARGRPVEVPVVNPVRRMAAQWGCSRKEAERRMALVVARAESTEG